MSVLHLIVIEDSEDDILLLLRALKTGGYKPVHLQVATEEAFREALPDSRWELVLSDHSMPRFSAPRALEVLKESGRDLPFIIVSGSIGEETAVAAMRAGAHDYIMKDNLARLVPAVERELREAAVRRERRRAEESLRISEERFRVALKNSPITVAHADRNLRYTWVYNLRQQYYDDPADIIGKRDDEIARNDGTTKLVKLKQKVLERGAGSRAEISFPSPCGVLTYDITAEPLLNSAGQIVGVTTAAIDITERKQYEEKLKYLSLHDQLTGLYNRAYFEEELNRMSSRRRDYAVAIISADLDGLKLVNDTLGHDRGDALLKACAAVLRKNLRKCDVVARVGGDEFAVVMPRISAEAGENVCRRIKTAIAGYNATNPDVPLSLSLGLAHCAGGNTSLFELFKLADDLMYRDKLTKSAGARNKIVETLLAALAERDFVTEGHTRRLAELCHLVGEKAGLTYRQLADLALLSQVHDLGKVGIPDHILYKEGPLTPAEWKIMQKHPEKGHRIAVSSPDLSPVADLILKHHERWDGKGYPLGLKGEEIPVECRILAVVDAYDAMTNKRPYNQVKSREEALAELKRCAGTQFAPAIVDIFLSIINHSPKTPSTTKNT